MKQKQRKFLRTFGGEKAVRNGERSLAERLLHNFLTSGHPNATGQVIFGWPEGKFDSFLSYDSYGLQPLPHSIKRSSQLRCWLRAYIMVNVIPCQQFK